MNTKDEITKRAAPQSFRKQAPITMEEFSEAAGICMRFAKDSSAGIIQLTVRDANNGPLLAIVVAGDKENAVALASLADQLE